MIRLRVSDLDAWLNYVEPPYPEMEVSTESFLAYMRREAPPSDDMRAGSAFHALLETMREGEEIDGLVGVSWGGFTFRCDVDFALALPAVREPEIAERVYHTLAGPVLLRGRIDGRDPGTTTDYKLSAKFDAERYARSLQWRAYLDMTGDRRFRYLVFENNRKGRDVWIYDVHTLDLWAYEGMRDEIQRRVSELAEFVAGHVPQLVEAA